MIDIASWLEQMLGGLNEDDKDLPSENCELKPY